MHIEVRDKLADAMVSADPNLHIFNPSVMFGFHTCTGARRVEQGGKAAEFYSYMDGTAKAPRKLYNIIVLDCAWLP